MPKENNWNTYLDATTVEIISLVSKYFNNDHNKVALWMSMDNLNFGGCSPNRLIKRNRGHKVLQFVKQSLEEDYAAIIKANNIDDKA